MKAVNIYYPSKLSIGAGCIGEFIKDASGKGVSRIFILSFPEIQPALGTFMEGLRNEGMELETDLSIQREPTVGDYERLISQVRGFKPDLVLGIGGGSILDVAKLLAAQLDNTQSIQEITGINLLKGRNTLMACMPTTSGTGSEVSPNAILLDEEEQLKKGIISPYLVPDMVYIDPELTLSVPAAVTAATGIDAFTHCLEAYVNKNAHPVIDTFALEGMALIAGSLSKAVMNGQDVDARNDLSLGSMYGGMCLGPVNTTAIHALSYPLGSEFHIAHGLSNALLLPYIMEFNLPYAVERYARVAEILGVVEERSDVGGSDVGGSDVGGSITNGSDLEKAEKGIQAVRDLIKDCGIPSRISELDIPETAIPRMAAASLKVQRLLVNNPREVTLQDAIDIYTKAY